MTSLNAILDVLGHNDDFPVSKHLMPLDSIMRRLGYTYAARQDVLSHAARFGSVQGCPTLEETEAAEDIDVLEAFLPRSAKWMDARWDDHVFTTTTA